VGKRFLRRNGIQCDIARDVPRRRLGRGSLRSREGERDNEESLGVAVAVAVGGGHGGEERGGKMERTMSPSRPRHRHPAPYDLLIPLDLLRMAPSMASRVVYAGAV